MKVSCHLGPFLCDSTVGSPLIMIVFSFVCRKYQPIKSYDQRCKYKQEFQAQYKEYRELKENVDSVSMKFSELDRLRRKYPDDSDEAQV